jgi:predicted short-subunit dehydrogenase-like oxidoreductase (DUF2520 family)
VSAGLARRRAALLPGVPVRPVDDVVRAADLVLLTVPDDASPTSSRPRATGALQRGTLLAHTSGPARLAVLEPAVAAGALPLALHPGAAVRRHGRRPRAARRHGVRRHRARAAAAGRRGAGAGDGRRAGAADRGAAPLWHAALAHGANHLTTLVSSAADLLRAAGVAAPGPVLAPLLGSALDGALRSGDAR